MQHILGVDGTVTAVTLENRFRTIILNLQNIEKDYTLKNQYKADIVKSNKEDSEKELMTGSVVLYVYINNYHNLIFPDPYHSSVDYEPGTGSSLATNFNEALAETIFLLYKAEGNIVNNPNKLDRKISTPVLEFLEIEESTPVNHNALLSVDYEIPIITIVGGESTSTTARAWLEG